jgi:hypothetical protein
MVILARFDAAWLSVRRCVAGSPAGLPLDRWPFLERLRTPLDMISGVATDLAGKWLP